ncbi:zinc ABC transporter substrate-binding protein [Aeromicrobium camelliae]|uniref:Zinc ABC transporter substrate-binding protein n=1 Tax=Aeromicrobium camelliae TaxID=1538144 RepID=A0A3N6ZCG4_9ACTN|nr:zinc ABC transporter substrate-binding protein [Aeromicrobium camelliae]RQN07881.1 zinc ABC transporter substrate-binding protein [Aeromicrobium camelliae]
MKRSALPALVVSALALSACGGGTSGEDGGGGVRVVASFYPAQFIAERVGGDLVDIETLTSPGGEAHDLELTAKQIGAVQSADVLVYLDGFQTAVDEAVEQADRDAATTVDLAEGVDLLDAQDPHDHEHSHEGEESHDHSHESEESHDHGHDHGDVDPHLWLDPANLEPAAKSLADALSEADPDHADEYAANAQELVDDLTALDEEFATGLATCERRDFVTSHAAFAYLAHAYDLHQLPIAGIDPGAEPTTAQLGEITELVQTEGITTIFTETLASPALAETVARETGATTATLDPIEGLADETSDQDYLSIMRANLAALQKANDCR